MSLPDIEIGAPDEGIHCLVDGKPYYTGRDN